MSINDKWQVRFQQKKYDISVIQIIPTFIATSVDMGSLINKNYFHYIIKRITYNEYFAVKILKYVMKDTTIMILILILCTLFKYGSFNIL